MNIDIEWVPTRQRASVAAHLRMKGTSALYEAAHDELGLRSLYADLTHQLPVVSGMWIARTFKNIVGIAAIDSRSGSDDFLKPHLQLYVEPLFRHACVGDRLVQAVIASGLDFYVFRTVSSARLYDRYGLLSHPIFTSE